MYMCIGVPGILATANLLNWLKFEQMEYISESNKHKQISIPFPKFIQEICIMRCLGRFANIKKTTWPQFENMAKLSKSKMKQTHNNKKHIQTSM